MFPVSHVLDNFFPIYPQDSFLDLNRRSLSHDLKNRLGSFNEIKAVEDNKHQLTLGINCESFKPEEIKVKVEKNYVVIEGKHESKNDHSYVKREFSRKFHLPENTDQTKMKCLFTHDGVLKVSIPKLNAIKDSESTAIPIEFEK